MAAQFDQDTIEKCYSEVLNLHRQTRELETEYQEELEKIPSNFRASALNLLHYLALRKNDIRQLQTELGNLGLSSLGRSESHVIASLENVMDILHCISENKNLPAFEVSRPFRNTTGRKILNCHADQLLGPSSSNRNTRIMVTLPKQAASNPILIRELINAGMNIARINCAHDSEDDWLKMIRFIRETEMETRKTCLVLMDLAGPKLRTGEIEPAPASLKIKPVKDTRGMVIKPAVLKIFRDDKANPLTDNEIAIEALVFEKLATGDILKFKDIPGRKREIRIFLKNRDYVLGEVKKTTYLENGTSFKIYRNKKKTGTGLFKDIPLQPGEIKVYKGDYILIANGDQPGRPAQINPVSNEREPARIPCSIPQIFSQVKPHESILFDDGKIAGIVEEVTTETLTVLLTRVEKKGATLTSDKGLNFPDSNLNIEPITAYDRQCLDFALRYADIVGFSFVKKAEDIEDLIRLMDKAQRMVGLILKIETRMAFENLPFLLLTGLRRPPLGVMVARGDLGIEMGFERMAEVQEEILWLCEAAHVPVIWATQVLEQMNKKGLPSRSEITDAAMSSRAECVMLNKGNYMTETVKFLDDILTRMQDHQQKKTPTLRRLRVTENL